MSTYAVDISLAPKGSAPTHSWTINSGDTPNPADTSQVLDNLSLTWSQPENDPYPAQPDPVQCRLALLLDDAGDLGDIAIGDIANVEVTSAGNVLGQLSGSIAQMTAVPVKRLDPATGATVLKVRFDLFIVELYVELADLKVSLERPVESISARQAAIHDAVTAAGGPETWSLGGDGDNSALLEALSAKNQPALDLVLDVLANWGDADAPVPGRRLLWAGATDDSGSWELLTRSHSPNSAAAMVYPPGVLAMSGHLLSLTFDGATPSPAGLLVDAAQVELDSIQYVALKYATVSKVKMTGTTLGEIEVSNGMRGSDYALSTTLTDPADAEEVARWFLPPADATRWTLDQFTWRPSDAELAAFDYPLLFNSQSTDVTTTMVERAPVAIVNVPEKVQPGSDDPFYAGTLSALTLTIRKGVLTFTGRLARRIKTDPARSVTIADVQANFPTVALKSGTDVVDPALSIYEAKLARKM